MKSLTIPLRTSGAVSASQDATYDLRLRTRPRQSELTLAVSHSGSGGAEDSLTGYGRGRGARSVTRATWPGQV